MSPDVTGHDISPAGQADAVDTPADTAAGAPAGTTSSAGHGEATTQAIRVVVRLLFVNLALSAVLAGLTLLFHQQILDYQLAHHLGAAPGQDPQALRQQLSITLWTRPIPIAIVALVYVLVARALHRGSRRAYLRVRAVSVVGLLAVLYYLFSGEYPGWLRVVEVVQLVPLAALVVMANRSALRTAFAKKPAAARRTR